MAGKLFQAYILCRLVRFDAISPLDKHSTKEHQSSRQHGVSQAHTRFSTSSKGQSSASIPRVAAEMATASINSNPGSSSNTTITRRPPMPIQKYKKLPYEWTWEHLKAKNPAFYAQCMRRLAILAELTGKSKKTSKKGKERLFTSSNNQTGAYVSCNIPQASSSGKIQSGSGKGFARAGKSTRYHCNRCGKEKKSSQDLADHVRRNHV